MKIVLICEDEKEIRETLKKRLEKSGFKVFDTGDPHEALSLSRDLHPDLIILDIAIPLMNGYEVCEELKKDPQTEDIRVLFFSGKDLDPKSIAEHCESLGAYGFISKLSTFEELLKKIKESIGE
jgi:CheY-like chemotaxis protein